MRWHNYILITQYLIFSFGHLNIANLIFYTESSHKEQDPLTGPKEKKRYPFVGWPQDQLEINVYLTSWKSRFKC